MGPDQRVVELGLVMPPPPALPPGVPIPCQWVRVVGDRVRPWLSVSRFVGAELVIGQ